MRRGAFWRATDDSRSRSRLSIPTVCLLNRSPDGDALWYHFSPICALIAAHSSSMHAAQRPIAPGPAAPPHVGQVSPAAALSRGG